MNELFHLLQTRMQEKKNSMLTVIVEGSGSLPRKAGAYMAVGKKGRLAGTIGGGNLEYQAVLTAQQLLAEKKSGLREYHLSAQAASNLGMVCGGSAKVLFYFLDAGDAADVQWVDDAVQAAQSGQSYWLILPIESGKPKIIWTGSPKQSGSDDGTVFPGAWEKNGLQHRKVFEQNRKSYYAEQFAYDGTVYLFGGGHLAQELVPLLTHLDFRCVVADDRPEFSAPELFPGAAEVVCADFAVLEKQFSICQNDYIAVMTRGHLCDTEVERFALGTDACYIGVVGSRRKTKFVREKLLAEGYTKEQLDRIVTPIGLDIGSETPAEIAVSIAAQLIAVRAGKTR